MEVGLVQKIDIDQEMQQAYLDYAMSVIVARALPDARDGLKPVHRRILYAMHDMGLRPETPYKKSARIVGEVLGKYHPHSDMAVYDAMARMAQDFSMRYLLVDGQGNFGSVDGDPPAAMRYTEARLTATAITMLTDIQKNTVNFIDNFDGTLTEPSVLPSSLPNMLVNGATGIAVGMATNIPPHNLSEIVDALRYLLEKWEKMEDITLDDLMQFIQGPDFPTGGVILHQSDQEDEGLRSAYGSGRGRITLQAKAHLEEMERGRNRIIVTELPFMTNKASLIERIAQLAREEKIVGISDLRDESDRRGMRIVIELSKSVEPEAILRELYKFTPMQGTFGITLLALVDGEPRLLSLKTALRVFIEHRLEIVRRRSEFDLARAKARAHILEGLRIALQNLDEVISIIRKSPDADTARTRLMKRFKLTEVQAQAILDMPLRRLAALERKKIEEEYKEVLATIKELESLLRSPRKMRQVVSDELLSLKETFGDKRKTQIVGLKQGTSKTSLLTAQDLLPDKTVWIALTPDGFISRSVDDKQPRTTGKNAPSHLVQANSRDTLFLVSEQGEASALAVHAVPELDPFSEQGGVPFWNISPFSEQHRLCSLFSLAGKERPADRYILTISKLGMVKKSSLSELPGPSAATFTLAKTNQGDSLLNVHLTDGSQEIMLATAQGMAIRFSEEEVRPMGLVAAGVSGIKLKPGDMVVGSECLDSKPDPKKNELLLVSSNGNAKRVKINEFPVQGRYGQGVIAWKLPVKDLTAGFVIGKATDRVTLHFVRLAAKPMRLDEAPLQGRSAQGKKVIEVKPGDAIFQISMPRGAGEQINYESEKPVKKPATRRTASEPKSKPTGTEKPPRSRTASSTTASKPGTRSKTQSAEGLPGKTRQSRSTKVPAIGQGEEKAAKSRRTSSTTPAAGKSVDKSPGRNRTADQPTVAKSSTSKRPPAKTSSERTSSRASTSTKKTAIKTEPEKTTPPTTPTARTTTKKTTPRKSTSTTTSAQKTDPGKVTPAKTSSTVAKTSKSTSGKSATTKNTTGNPAPKRSTRVEAPATKETSSESTPGKQKTRKSPAGKTTQTD